MKEIVFLKKYQEKWKDLEALLATSGKKDPDQLSELFIHLTDDLSYARTYYPDSNTTKYLNTLSAQLHQEIYKNKKERSGRFVYFWQYEVPLVMARNLHIVLLAFMVFLLSFGIGWLSANNDDSFVRLILGDGYVNMTEENIKDGKPMDVYGKMEEGGMFLYITLNNIYVSFLFFVLGVTFGIGSIWKLIQTGIMVGAFLAFFYQQDLLVDAMLAIWMHGTIEISVAIIAGAAGIVLGKSITFPRTYSRLESVKRGAKDGLKMVIGLIPCFIIAGFIESFLTRHYNFSPVFTASVIFLSLAFILTYFVFYPLYVARKMKMNLPITIKPGTQQITIGVVFLAVGLLITIASFTSSSRFFVVMTGPIIYGIVLIVRGVNYRIKANGKMETV